MINQTVVLSFPRQLTRLRRSICRVALCRIEQAFRGNLGLLFAFVFATSATAAQPSVIWVDADTGCNMDRKTDPDDCLALHFLSQHTVSSAHKWIGVSVTHGNLDFNAAQSVMLELRKVILDAGGFMPPLFAGAKHEGDVRTSSAAQEICRILGNSPLVLVMLGPFTTASQVVNNCPAEARQHLSIFAVAGRRPGHVFHPAEERAQLAFLGHGPIFRDFNVAKDEKAAMSVARSGVPLTLTPYELARQFEITARDVEHLRQAGTDRLWLAERATAWLSYWQDDMGRAGFYPFDLMAVLAVTTPDAMDCTRRTVTVKRDGRIGFWGGPISVLFDDVTSDSRSPHTVCHRLTPIGRTVLRRWLLHKDTRENQ